jgi:hypothetical protein
MVKMLEVMILIIKKLELINIKVVIEMIIQVLIVHRLN